MEIIRPDSLPIQMDSAAEDIMHLVDSYYSGIDNLCQSYASRYDAVHADAESKIRNTGYGLGMEGAIHRGCYSPSSLCDVVIENCCRGKASKKPGKGSCFQFGFDETGYPVSTEHLYNGQPVSWEGIYQESDRALGLLYTTDGKTKLDGISLEFYDEQNRIEEYCFSRPKASRSLTIEHYWYNGNNPEGFLLLMVISYRNNAVLRKIQSFAGEPLWSDDAMLTLVRGVKCFEFSICDGALAGYRTQLFSIQKADQTPSDQWIVKSSEPQYCEIKPLKAVSFARRRKVDQ